MSSSMSSLPLADGHAVEAGSPTSQGGDIGQTLLQACRRCNEKKTRCDKKWPTCSICEKRHVECVYAGPPRRRGPGKSKQHVQQLEERLKKMEAMIQLQQKQQHESVNAATAVTPTSQYTYTASSAGSFDASSGIGAQADVMTDSSIFPSSGHPSAHSPGSSLDPALQTHIPQPPSHALDSWRERVRGSMEMPNSQMMLTPSKRPYSSSEISWFVVPLLEEINAQLPIFNVDKLVQKIDRTPSASERSPAWTTLIESLMARVMLVRAASDSIVRCYDMAWAQMRGGLSRVSALVLDVDADASQGGGNDVVDALLSMALFMRGTADTRATAMLVRTALQCHWVASMTASSGWSGMDHSRARNLASRKLWALYVIDQELSLYHGTPPCIREADIDMSVFPINKETAPYTLQPARSRPHGLFWARVALATVESQVQSRLFSPQAKYLSPADRSTAATELHAMVRAQFVNVCPYFVASPAGDRTAEAPTVGIAMASSMTDISIVMLVITVCSSLNMVYHAVARGYDANNIECDAVVQAFAMKYLVGAARGILSSLGAWPPSTLPELWQLIPYGLSAALCILEVLLNATEITTQRIEDARAVVSFARYVCDAAATKGYPLNELVTGCNEIARLAQAAVSRTDSGQIACPDAAVLATVRDLLARATHPMYVARDLVGNLPTRDHRVARELAKLLLGEELVAAMPPERAPFAPDILHYHTRATQE